jgi:ubiquinone biosynthesis protein UbiJ
MEMSDWQTYINTGLGAIFVAISAWVKSIHSGIREQEQALAAYKTEVAEKYVTHTALSEIKDTLHRIEDKLDGKADK